MDAIWSENAPFMGDLLLHVPLSEPTRTFLPSPSSSLCPGVLARAPSSLDQTVPVPPSVPAGTSPVPHSNWMNAHCSGQRSDCSSQPSSFPAPGCDCRVPGGGGNGVEMINLALSSQGSSESSSHFDE